MQAASLANHLVETETENVCVSLTTPGTQETELPWPQHSPVSSTGGHVLMSTAAAASRDRNNLQINCVVIKQAERLTWKFKK